MSVRDLLYLYSMDQYNSIPISVNKNEISDKSRSIIKETRKYLDTYPWFWTMIILFTVLGFATRIYNIAEGDYVVWDEAHFGKFGSYYLKREFYFDVHPNLGKMLIGLSGWLCNYNGTFSFDSGSKYPEWVDYVFMRIFTASFGALLVPLAYATAVQMGMSPWASFIIGLSCVCENGFISVSRLILLDPILLFFTVATTLGMVSLIKYFNEPFGKNWWISLISTGICIGCVTSVKWVGLFTTSLVGIHAIEDLWSFLGDIRLPKKIFIKHISARVLFLISTPVFLYTFFFFLHFKILNNSGPGDSNMSSLFQAGLINNQISKSPIDVAYNSLITIRNQEYGGGLLHSHHLVYPEGSKQQQVTGYHHRDANNDWKILPIHGKNIDDWTQHPIEYLRNNHIIRLLHVQTRANLHSHLIPASIEKSDYEVSCYGNDSSIPDPNDHWVVEIVDDKMGLDESNPVRSLSTTFRLKHHLLGCYLSSTKHLLPQWGSGQLEVSCDKKSKGRNTLWNIESQVNDRLPPGNSSLYKSRFVDDFVECNVGMWRTNDALRPDPDLEPQIITSTVLDWPFMRAGIRMTSWDNDKIKFFMLGNPIVWWSGIASVIILTILGIVYLCLWQRGVVSYPTESLRRLNLQSKVCVGGWILHYLPFCLMGRVLYVHHYYPCLFYSTLAIGSVFDHLFIERFHSRRIRTIITAVISIVIATVFYMFSPLCYGIHGPADHQLYYLNWVSSWKLF